MKLWMRLLVRIGLALFLTAFLAPGYAADAHMYRCVNANGRVYYSDLPGTECVEGEHDRLTRDGLVLDRPVDEAEKEAAAAKAAAEQQRELLAQKRRDRMLIAIYTSPEQIEDAKQRRLQTPRLSLELSIKKITIYRERLIELKQIEAAHIERKKAIPASVKTDIKAAESDITRLARELESKQTSVDQIVKRFDEDKERYRELTIPNHNK
jgi:hypothetical protein